MTQNLREQELLTERLNSRWRKPPRQLRCGSVLSNAHASADPPFHMSDAAGDAWMRVPGQAGCRVLLTQASGGQRIRCM
jgi:hypothetical protein